MCMGCFEQFQDCCGCAGSPVAVQEFSLFLFLILQAKAEVAAGDHPTVAEMKGEPNNVAGNQSRVETEA